MKRLIFILFLMMALQLPYLAAVRAQGSIEQILVEEVLRDLQDKNALITTAAWDLNSSSALH